MLYWFHGRVPDAPISELFFTPLCTGRVGIAPARLLRCCVLKHLKAWSFRTLEGERRANLLYRRFTRFDADRIPTYATFSRTFALLGPALTTQIQQRTVQQARQAGVAPGRTLRTDTPVVETNIHHPTDSSQLADGIRVLTRSMQRVGQQCRAGAVQVVDHARSVTRRLLEISRAAKSQTAQGKARLTASYGKLVALTRRVTRQATQLLADLSAGQLPLVGRAVTVVTQEAALRQHPAARGAGHRPDHRAAVPRQSARGGQGAQPV